MYVNTKIQKICRRKRACIKGLTVFQFWSEKFLVKSAKRRTAKTARERAEMGKRGHFRVCDVRRSCVTGACVVCNFYATIAGNSRGNTAGNKKCVCNRKRSSDKASSDILHKIGLTND
jgi:hypothetical protein